MMEQYISTLLSSLFSFYLPIAEMGTRIAVSMALANIITSILRQIYDYFSASSSLWHFLWKEQRIEIAPDNPTYWKIIEYLYEKYAPVTKSCKLESDFGKNKMIISQLSQKALDDPFEHEDKTYAIKIRFEDLTSSSGDNNKGNKQRRNDGKHIVITSDCTIKILEVYLNDLIRRCNEKTASGIYVYKLSVDDNKNRVITWRGRNIKISKNLKNTIVSEEVDKSFYQDMSTFIGAEKQYLDQGLPYKRGYILYGPPGCGKTSLVKAIGNEYQLPIFILDLSILESNHELTKAVNNISSFVAYDQKHLLVMEDVDRTKVFKKPRYYYDDDVSTKKITEDCILNVLDGIDENYGRITIMTTNEINVLENVKALMRPGRIDKIVEVTYCTQSQISNILQFFFGGQKEEIQLEDKIQISPAKLVHMIKYLGDIEQVIHLLNKVKDFISLDVNKIAIEGLAAEMAKEDEDTDGNKPNFDMNDNDEDELSYRERRIGRDVKRLKRMKLEYELEKEGEDTLGELDKLRLEKKRINLVLLENKIKTARDKAKLNEFRVKHCRRDSKISKSEILGLEEEEKPGPINHELEEDIELQEAGGDGDSNGLEETELPETEEVTDKRWSPTTDELMEAREAMGLVPISTCC